MIPHCFQEQWPKKEISLTYTATAADMYIPQLRFPPNLCALSNFSTDETCIPVTRPEMQSIGNGRTGKGPTTVHLINTVSTYVPLELILHALLEYRGM